MRSGAAGPPKSRVSFVAEHYTFSVIYPQMKQSSYPVQQHNLLLFLSSSRSRRLGRCNSLAGLRWCVLCSGSRFGGSSGSSWRKRGSYRGGRL